jgi:muconolactone D-isomerase
MLFLVTMDVRIPHDAAPDHIAALKAAEKARCGELMASGEWRHIWRVAGYYRNRSVFDVPSNAALHDILLSLPLFPFMAIEVEPLCRHPSSIRDDDS